MDPWFEAHIIMHSLPKMHEVNIYRIGHVHLYVGMFPLQTTKEAWYWKLQLGLSFWVM
jgi:hypothetical protein